MARGKAVAVLRPVWPALTCVLVFGASPGLLFGCGGKEHASPYAAAVFDDPPVYCYRTIGDVDCYARPLHRAEQRLVNFYGPPPDDYERPALPPAPLLHAPPLRSVPAPAEEAAVAPAPVANPANQPIMLFPSDPPTHAKAGAGEGERAAAPATATATTTKAAASPVNSPKPATAAGAEKPGVASPRPRPPTSTAASSPPQNAPLVIEVEGH